MARANCITACSLASWAATNVGSAARILETGIGTPIMPVEDGNTSSALNPSRPDAFRQTCKQSFMPALPVAQLALPEFTITARTCAPVARKCLRPISTGAAITRFFVNTAAAVVPGAASAKAKSNRPLALIPAATAENENPPGRWMDSVEPAGAVMPGA